ncbi:MULTISPECIES: hypothetical protein [Sphingomonas]|uniref:Uncharacterized protein n=1 Tax=Sphingomonas trueperi TaxID=53317 RepID=A0A7X5XY62_9SPHN|nr:MULTISPECIES: hypothetical protein [Sphingomonas]NJB96380.1 hypothetical protein [Sphingomonas trueperi]
MDPRTEPVEKRARKGFGAVALIILAIIATVFVGYNIYYAVTPG